MAGDRPDMWNMAAGHEPHVIYAAPLIDPIKEEGAPVGAKLAAPAGNALVLDDGRCGCCKAVGDHPCGHECDSCDGSGDEPELPACTLPHGDDCTCTEAHR
jgi:hypothetical protein